MVTLLDGAIGTALAARGVPTEGPGWSAFAARDDPAQLAQLHQDYAAAGSTVHTANTFRTRPQLGLDWTDLLRRSVELASANDRVVFGSLAPAADCYAVRREDPAARADHEQVAAALVAAGVQGLLVETFVNEWEAVLATQVAVATGLPVWTALSPGPDGTLLPPEQLRRAACQVAEAGADAVLVNCVGPEAARPFVRAVKDVGVRFGVYLNAGPLGAGMGWGQLHQLERWLDAFDPWLDAGATILGGCCGTTPEHIRAIADRLSRR